MIWHQMTFYNLYALVCAKIMQDLSQILLVLIVDYFSSILWRKDDMVLAQPFGMCSTICLWHEITFPFSVVALADLMYVAKDLIGLYYETDIALAMLVGAYLMMLLPISLVFSWIERRLRHAGFGNPSTLSGK